MLKKIETVLIGTSLTEASDQVAAAREQAEVVREAVEQEVLVG